MLTIQKMLRNKVLLRRHEPDEKLGSGLLFRPDTAIDKNIRCTVLKVGPGVKKEKGYTPVGVKEGDVVVVRQFDGDPVGDSINNPDVVVVNHDVVEAIDVDGEIKPLGDRLLLKVEPMEEKLGSGILWAPPTVGNQKTHDRAVVLAVGPGKILANGVQLPASCSVGDTVILPKFRGTSIDSKTYGKCFLVSESEILLIDLNRKTVRANVALEDMSFTNSENQGITAKKGDFIVVCQSGAHISCSADLFPRLYVSTGCCDEYVVIPYGDEPVRVRDAS